MSTQIDLGVKVDRKVMSTWIINEFKGRPIYIWDREPNQTKPNQTKPNLT